MAIRINLDDRSHEAYFNFLYDQIRFVSVSNICKKGKYFEDFDSWKVSGDMANILLDVWSAMRKRYGVSDRFAIPVNSLSRKPYTVLYNGSTDYLDLTTIYSHWMGVSVDIDFKMFETETDMPRTRLMKTMYDCGLFAPFWVSGKPHWEKGEGVYTDFKLTPKDIKGEYWHWSIKPEVLRAKH